MATVSRRLPAQPHLDVPKREARELLEQWRLAEPSALARIRGRHPKFHGFDDGQLAAAKFLLSDAQLVLAREYSFSTWAELKRRIALNSQAQSLEDLIRRGEREKVVQLLRANPDLLHLPVRSGHWGPPMSYAANLGRIEIIKAVAELGAKDSQHAFDRALLQGKIECARWLHERGAKLEDGIVMGPCETLNPDGLRFLAELNAPFTDKSGNPRAPLAMVLETYTRNPPGKHQVLEIFTQKGHDFPDTVMMAFHRGRVDLLAEKIRVDPALIGRRFSYREIYPPALGCHDDGRSGLHGTPIEGTTLLHLAIEFDEQEIFAWLLEKGADVNARATVDAEGFGGHTPLFNAVMGMAIACGRQREGAMLKALLAHGASPEIRTNLRKFLDWQKKPAWHYAHNVTAFEWARDFPEKNWVSKEALALLGREVMSDE